MLMRFDPIRELDRLSQQLWRGLAPEASGATLAPMDAYRTGDTFVVELDLPGVDPGSIDVSVDGNVLNLTAYRHRHFDNDDDVVAAERLTGEFRRQLFLGDMLDTEHIAASYDAGVLRLELPVAERAKPRRIEVTAGAGELTVNFDAAENRRRCT
jgi:HSP20 family protein